MIKEGKQERSHNKSSKHPKDHYQFYNLRKGNENTIPNNGIRTRGLKNVQESANIKSGKKKVTATKPSKHSNGRKTLRVGRVSLCLL